MPQSVRGKTTRAVVDRARNLRREQTPAEVRLWLALRNRQLAGLKFRRQHPYGQFILDLFCVEHQLAVEVDGAVHHNLEQAAHDAERSEFLAQRGVRVLRFTNEEIEQRLPDVLRKIIEAASPSPDDVLCPFPTHSVGGPLGVIVRRGG
jgi:very-short-patch-repair endonuclease